MPQIFKIGSYIVYFWSDEGLPTEPVHVHVAEGRPIPNGTKIWITKSLHGIVAHNKSKNSKPYTERYYFCNRSSCFNHL